MSSSSPPARSARLDQPEALLLRERVIDQVRDHAIFFLDAAGRMTSWNHGVCEVFGYDEDEWIDQASDLIYLAEDVARGVPQRELAEARTTGRASDDLWLRRRDGSPLFGIGTVSRIDDDNGNVVGFTKVVRDDTRRRQAEDERARQLDHESTARVSASREAATLTAAIEAIPDGVFVGHARGIERCNVAGLAQLGLSSPVELQVPLAELARRFRARHERDAEPMPAEDLPFARALRGEVASLQYWITKVGDEDLCLRTTAAPIVVDGTTVGAIAVSIDVSEQVHQEHRRRQLDRVETILRARDQELRALVDGVREYAIFTIDTDGLISSWHEGAQIMKGWTVEEAIGMPFANLFTPEDRAKGQPAREMRIASETGEYQGEGHRVRKNGEIFEAAVVLTALRDKYGDTLGYLKLTQDITARRRQEHDQHDALRDAEAARAAAERASRAMGEFLATISHELRTPLSAILGWAAVLSRTINGPTEAKRGLEAITRNARLQIGLIEDLLDMNRIEAGQLRLDIQPVDLATVIGGAMEASQPAARAKGLHVRTALDPISASVAGDAARLQQVVVNLLMNAVKFTPRGNTIRLGLKQVGEHVEVTVADTGQGIEASFLPHLFDRFRQQDATTTRRHGGLGLGLSIVKQITELHGGSVRVESPGADLGSTFTVSLSTMPMDAIDDMPSEETSPPNAPGHTLQRLDGKTVLLVDDDADVRDVAAMVLRDAGAHVTTAGSAREALALFRADRPHVLVTDIGMPDNNGYELLRWIRALGPDDGGLTPVIAFTAYATQDDKRRVKDAGFDGHLVKPVEPDALVESVRLLQHGAHFTLDGDKTI